MNQTLEKLVLSTLIFATVNFTSCSPAVKQKPIEIPQELSNTSENNDEWSDRDRLESFLYNAAKGRENVAYFPAFCQPAGNYEPGLYGFLVENDKDKKTKSITVYSKAEEKLFIIKPSIHEAAPDVNQSLPGWKRIFKDSKGRIERIVYFHEASRLAHEYSSANTDKFEQFQYVSSGAIIRTTTYPGDVYSEGNLSFIPRSVVNDLEKKLQKDYGIKSISELSNNVAYCKAEQKAKSFDGNKFQVLYDVTQYNLLIPENLRNKKPNKITPPVLYVFVKTTYLAGKPIHRLDKVVEFHGP